MLLITDGQANGQATWTATATTSARHTLLCRESRDRGCKCKTVLAAYDLKQTWV